MKTGHGLRDVDFVAIAACIKTFDVETGDRIDVSASQPDECTGLDSVGVFLNILTNGCVSRLLKFAVESMPLGKGKSSGPSLGKR